MILSLIFVVVHAPADLAQVALRSEEQWSEARRIYRINCRCCHGNTDGTAAKRKRFDNLPNFSSPNWHTRRSNEQLLSSILDGKGSSMPSFRDRLSDYQVHALVLFIRSLNENPSQAGQRNRHNFNERFQELQKEFERLRREFNELSER
jgi:mono/diheme cytochrome c family protein